MIYKILFTLSLLIGCITSNEEKEPKYQIGTCLQIQGLEGSKQDPAMQVKVYDYQLKLEMNTVVVSYVYIYWMAEHQKWSDPQNGIGKLETFEGMTYEVECPA